ncbi:unnamed protein product [Acanthoscelides obtectus]|nr:unnamed protein product [Acanthoscelides obtectus]CAK1658727.1 Apolipophorins [Acanthoscelides obtectus]
MLEKEPSYQVGGFIVSHIRNIKASANPDKDLAKQHLGFSLPRKFPIDPRKWSYSGEFSYAIDTLGLGASTEANVIYSQDSWLPRSSSLNLTAEIFGHNFNFLEIQTRQENLDRLVEHYFGPKGILRTSSLGDLYKNNEQLAKKLYKHLQEKLTSTLRARRDVSKAEIDKIGQHVQIKEHQLNKDLDLDISLKAFGSEVAFANLNVYQHGLTPEAVIDKIIGQFAQGLDKLKQFQDTLRANMIFMDLELDYPTSTGFPLRLGIEGTANVQMKTEGSVDVRAILNGKPNKIHVKLIPSASVELSARFTFDAHTVESGMKVITNLYTATGGDITVDMQGGANVDVKVGLPVKEMKLISANHEIVSHVREQSGQETNSPLKFAQAKDFSICLDQLSPFIGLTFCGEINGPNLAGKDVPVLPFPLAGDSKVSVTIENDDVLEYHFKHQTNNEHTSGALTIEAIGKNNQKKVSLQVNAEIHPEKYIKAEFTSPLKNANAEGRITFNDQEKSILLKAGYDQNEFYGKFGVGISGNGGKTAYKPILEWKSPGGTQQLPINVEGQLLVDKQGSNEKYTFDNIKLTLPNGKAVTLNGNLGNDGPALYTDLTVSDGQHSGNVKGRLHIDMNLLKVNAEVQNSINPGANFNVKGEVKRQPDEYDANLQVIHGADLSSKTNRLNLAGKLVRKYKSPQDFLFKLEGKASYPLIGVNGELEVEQTPKSVKYDADLQYNDLKFGSELDVNINKKEHGDFDVDFEVYGMDKKVEFKASRQIQGEESKISNELVVNDAKIEVKGKIKHHLQPNNVDVGADLVVILPHHNAPFKVNSGLKYNAQEVDAHHKVVSGSTVIIDAFIKANRQGTANASIKVNVKDMLVVNGQLKANKGTGNGDILIDAQNIKKQVKMETTFTIQPPTTVNVDFTIYPQFATDKNSKVHFSTTNKLNPNSVNSKNVVDILGKQLAVNVNGQRTGDPMNGKLNAEAEVILPDNQYLLGKINGDRKEQNGVINGQGIFSLEYRVNKNTPGRKLSLKAVSKDTNPKEGIYDLNYNLAADISDGKNINADISIQASKQGDERTVNLQNKVYGTLLENPLTANFQGKYKRGVSGTYDASASYGANAVLRLKGKHDIPGEGKPLTVDMEMDLTTPSKALKTVKAGTSLSLLHERSAGLQLAGSAHLFVDDDGSVPEPIIDFKGDGYIKATEHNGEMKANLQYGKHGPISGLAGYSLTTDGKKKQINGNLALQYDQGKNVKVEAALTKKEDHEYKLDVNMETPVENLKKVNLMVHTKRSPDQKHVESKVELNADGKVWHVDTEVKVSEIAPLLNIKVKCPEGKVSQIFFKGNKISDKEFSGELKLACQAKDFLLEGNLDANIDNIDQFVIKGNVNSPNLKLDKVHFEAQNEAAKTGRKIQITVKSNGQNLLSGSTTYNAHDEHGKYVVDGSGSFKVKEETKSANFKYIRRQLSLDKDGEQGIDVSFDATIGSRAIDAEMRLTNKNLRQSISYCEKSKDCAHVEIDSKISSNDVENYNHVLEINLDLRKLGMSHQFGLKSVTNRKKYVLDHTVDAHFQGPEKSNYQYSLYIHPGEAGASLTTPKRIIALETKANVAKNYKEGGKMHGEITFYLDKKNHPQKKTSWNGWLSVDIAKQTINGETKMEHPGLQRPLSSSIKTTRTGTATKGEVVIVAEFDIFAQPAQKLVTTYKHSIDTGAEVKSATFKRSLDVKSSGLGVDIHSSEMSHFDRQHYAGEYIAKVKYHVGNSKYDNVLSVNGGKSQLNVLVKLLNIELLKATNKMSLSKEEQTLDSEISSYSNNPLISHLEIKNFNTLLYTVGFKGTPRDKLQLNAGLIPGQIADVRADHSTGSGKTNLFHATLKLDDANFLKPDYNLNSKEIQKVLNILKEKIIAFVNGLQDIGEKSTNDIRKEVSQIADITKKAVPNLKPIKEYYATEIKEIKQEILEDPSVKELADAVRKVFGAIIHSLAEISAKVGELIEAVTKSLQTAFAGVIESIDKELLPELKRITGKVTKVAGEIARSAIDIIASCLATISQVIEKYQPEIKQIAATFGELGQDVGRFIQKSYEQIRAIVIDVSRKIYDEIQALPIFDELKAKYEELIKNGIPNKDGIIGGMKEIAATIKDIIPPDFLIQKELVEIIDLIVNYIEKKVNAQAVDEFAVLDKLAANNVAIVRKLAHAVSTPTYDVQKATTVPVSLDFLKKLPKLVAIKFSPIAYVLRDDPTEEIVAFALSLLNHPRQWFAPFPLNGMIVQGQHIFTFDGNHLTFPANCKYLFARDAVNGNFTLVGTYANGELSSISLADRTDIITIEKGGKVLLNGAPTELPTRKENIAVYRGYAMLTIKSTYGVELYCSDDLAGCGVILSGFYHAQVKGLLGNGNNEPYDDFTIPNGKIVVSEGEFGNSYKIGNCPQVNVPKHADHKNVPECTKLFSFESSMRYCFPFVSTEKFKTACVHGKEGGVKDTELNIAKAYVAACHVHNIPISVPSHLVHCENADKAYGVGDKFSVKLPGKAADIILLVDTAKENEGVYKDLIQPIVADVSKELKGKGISDVQFHLIAHGGENQWPSHVTVDGGKLTFEQNAPDIKFAANPKHEHISDSVGATLKPYLETLESVLHDLKLALGMTLEAKTYNEAISYPFRAHAVKAIIAVNSKPCEVGRLHLLQKLRALLYKDNKISLNLVTPFQGLNVKDVKKTKDVIGFNNDHVFTMSNKKPEGTAELYKDLEYSDFCADFTIRNRGNVFVTDNFLSASADAKKQFVQTAAHNIVDQLTNLEQGLDCECKMVNAYNARNVCWEAYSKEK